MRKEREIELGTYYVVEGIKIKKRKKKIKLSIDEVGE